jgi:hypothetical protein
MYVRLENYKNYVLGLQKDREHTQSFALVLKFPKLHNVSFTSFRVVYSSILH